MQIINQLREFVRSQPDVFRFLAFGFGGYIAWHLTYEEFLKPSTLLDEYVQHYVIVVSESILRFVGYEMNAYFELYDGDFRSHVGIMGAAGVEVGAPCDGVVLFALFGIFIASFPGKWKRKLWYIPLGIAVLHAANVFRIICLLLIQLYVPEALEFNHDYTFTVFVYSIIFLLWYLWGMHFSGLKLKVKEASS